MPGGSAPTSRSTCERGRSGRFQYDGAQAMAQVRTRRRARRGLPGPGQRRGPLAHPILARANSPDRWRGTAQGTERDSDGPVGGGRPRRPRLASTARDVRAARLGRLWGCRPSVRPLTARRPGACGRPRPDRHMPRPGQNPPMTRRQAPKQGRQTPRPSKLARPVRCSPLSCCPCAQSRRRACARAEVTRQPAHAVGAPGANEGRVAGVFQPSVDGSGCVPARYEPMLLCVLQLQDGVYELRIGSANAG